MKITVEQVTTEFGDHCVYVDVRSEIAFQHGHIPHAVHWNGSDDTMETLPNHQPLIVYCSYGEKSIPLAERLRACGYEAYNLSGGYREWLLKSFSEDLSAEEIARYDRQIILPQIGIDGQTKLKRSSVLIVGAGGLGAPAALYLAGAGVGRIGIADGDTVSISNLQRQIVHSMETASQNKAESAKQSLQRLNDQITVEAYPYALTPENAEEIIGNYDFIIDAVDNFPAKFLINDTCVILKKPFCHAGILQFEGQVMTYVPGEYPCYRCIFEEIPEQGTIPNCSQAGIIGAVAGIIGSIQALEAIKYLLGIGELLTGKIFIFNGLSMQTRIADFKKKNSSCRVCGDAKTIRNVKDYAEEYIDTACSASKALKNNTILI